MTQRTLLALVPAFLVAAVGLLPALAGTSATARAAGKEKVSGLAKEDYEKIYLAPGEIPGMRQTHDNRHRGADRDDRAYVRLGGLRSGSTVWHAERGKKARLNRVVDIRWVFPSAEAAGRYLKEQLSAMAEDQPKVRTLMLVGQECHVFGGLFKSPFGDVSFRHYIVIFRQGNVVVKFYAMHEDPNGPLRPGTLEPLCRVIEKRIKAVAR